MSEIITDRVQAQYTELPYPPREPEDERRRFIAVSDFHGLDKISDRCFAGRLPPDQDMRILLAGVGTGDAAVSLGEQLRHTSSEVVCVDLSATSLEIAQKRCEIRSIPNLRWRQGSLLELGPSEGTSTISTVAACYTTSKTLKRAWKH